MEKFKKEFFRDVAIHLLLFITYIFTITILFFCVYNNYKISFVKKIVEKSKYNSQMHFMKNRNTEEEVFLENNDAIQTNNKKPLMEFYKTSDFPDISEGILELQNMCTYVGEVKRQVSAKVLLIQDENINYPLEKGDYPTKRSPNGNYAVIGKGLERYVKISQGKQYLSIDNERYEIVGILHDITSNATDIRVLLFYDYMDNKLKKQVSQTLQGQGSGIFCLSYKSNRSDISKQISQIEDWLQDQLDSDVEITDYYEEYYESDSFLHVLEPLLNKMVWVLFIFCMIHCFIVMDLYTKRVQKEMNIRRLCGISFQKIYLKIFETYSLIYLFALLIFNFGAIIYLVFFKKLMEINLFFNIQIPVIVTMFGYLLFLTYCSLFKIRKKVQLRRIRTMHD